MRRMHRIVLLVGLVALAPVLAGCADFDMDKLDVFGLNEKKKLPGERKPVFPDGVPGVTQGVPPEYVKGNQPPPDTAQTPPVEPEAAAAAAEAGQEDRRGRAGRPKPQAETEAQAEAAHGQRGRRTQAPRSPQQAQRPASSRRPGRRHRQPQPAQSTSTAPWPSTPPPGTFSR